MIEADEAISYVDHHAVLKRLPLGDARRHSLTRHYIFARRTGMSHSEACVYASVGLDPVTILVLGWAVKLLFYLLKKWWDNRDHDAP